MLNTYLSSLAANTSGAVAEYNHLVLQYTSEQAMVSDFELMFNNARHYNEDGSQIYRDAELLERVMRSKLRSLLDVSPASKSHKRWVYTQASFARLISASDFY